MTYISESLRKAVEIRAGSRCEYCRLHEQHSYFIHEIDHIYAEKHGGETHKTNLCLACAPCNRYKGSDLCSLDHETKQIVPLFHPRQDIWETHFELQLDGLIRPLTPTGRVTARILNFNRDEMVAERERLLQLGVY
jgi:hypothetical protein